MNRQALKNLKIVSLFHWNAQNVVQKKLRPRAEVGSIMERVVAQASIISHDDNQRRSVLSRVSEGKGLGAFL